MAKSCYSNMPPDDYDEFVEAAIQHRENGMAWSRKNWEDNFGVCAVDQFKDADLWEKRVLVREDEAGMGCNELVSFDGCKKWWHQACHLPAIYLLPPGRWLCHHCQPAPPSPPSAAPEVEAASDEDDEESSAEDNDEEPTAEEAAPDEPARARVRAPAPCAAPAVRARRGTANYEAGANKDTDGCSHRELHGLDASRKRSSRTTWDRVGGGKRC